MVPSGDTTGDEALERLLEGNRRFAAGEPLHPGRDDVRRAELAEGQEPYAIVVGCADSRVPPEVIFDTALGELFVIRVAGNTVVERSVLGGVEFAATRLGSSLLVVLGHQSCGAVQAAVAAVTEGASAPGAIGALVDPIVAPVAELVEREPGLSGDGLIAEAVRANVRHAVEALRSGDSLIRPLVDDGGLKVVGAEYLLATGEVVLL